MFQTLRSRLKTWWHGLLRRVMVWALTKLAVAGVKELDWFALGKTLNERTDTKLGAKLADPVQQALAEGLEQTAKGLRV